MKNIFKSALCLLCYAKISFASISNEEILNTVRETLNKIDANYVNPVNKEKLLEGALSGMMQTLDPHSSYLNQDAMDSLANFTEGEFGGIGIEIMYDNGAIKVISPIEDLPAEKAGIKPLDYIVEVNKEKVLDLGFEKAVKNIKGKPGTKVTVSVIREGESAPIEFNITRDIVKVSPVKHAIDEDILYLRLTTFNKQTYPEMKKVVEDALYSNKKINGIILDLRSNPGGLLKSALEVSEYFIQEGTIVSTDGKTKDSKMLLVANKYSKKCQDVPMIVLINNGSASASEILAGALQDHKRAIILGTKSFGKGSVQNIYSLSQKGALKMTTSLFYTPNLKAIQAEGITPDIYVEQLKVEYTKDTHKLRHEKDYQNHLEQKPKLQKNSASLPVNLSKDSKMSEQYKNDYQYSHAFDLLKAMKILIK
jgi:carboxyl-terminal processing protease